MYFLGDLTLFFGLQICQHDKDIFISQTKYIKEMLKKFGMKDSKPTRTSMQTSCKLRKEYESKVVDHRLYISMVGILLYVTMSRLDVIQEVGKVVIFQETPEETHVMLVNRIFRYIKLKKDFGLWYPKGNDISLVSYMTTYWEGRVDDRRNTIGSCFYLGEWLVSWLSKK
jgi:hypothetical protein